MLIIDNVLFQSRRRKAIPTAEYAMPTAEYATPTAEYVLVLYPLIYSEIYYCDFMIIMNYCHRVAVS